MLIEKGYIGAHNPLKFLHESSSQYLERNRRLTESLGKVPLLSNTDIWVCYIGAKNGVSSIEEMRSLIYHLVYTHELGNIPVGYLSKISKGFDLSKDKFLSQVCFNYDELVELSSNQNAINKQIDQELKQLLDARYISSEAFTRGRIELTGKKVRNKYETLMLIAREAGVPSQAELKLESESIKKLWNLWEGWMHNDYIRDIFGERVIPNLGEGDVIKASRSLSA